MVRFSGIAVIGFVILSLPTMTGCGGGEGPNTVSVTGSVTLDGSPVAGAQVVFSPTSGGQAASGTTDASGEYELTTLNPSDGAVPGSYRVAVSKSTGGGQEVDLSGLSDEEAMKKSMEAFYSSDAYKQGGATPKAETEVKDELPAMYKDPNNSGFTADVKKGEKNKFDFALTSGGAAPQ